MSEYENSVKEIVKLYYRLLNKHHVFPYFNQDLVFYDSIKERNCEHHNSEQFILAVETCYFALREDYRLIIKHAFFYRNFSFWWEDFFTKKQYYRLKKDAVNCFYSSLAKLDVINENGTINYDKYS